MNVNSAEYRTQDKIIVTIHDNLTRFFVVKNVKIDEETHRMLSIAASTMCVQKGILCSALIRAALQQLPKKTTQEYINEVSSHEISMRENNTD